MKSIYTSTTALMLSLFTWAQVPALVADLNVGPGNLSPSSLTIYNGNLYFSGDDSSGLSTGSIDLGRELWKTDGTASGSSVILDINTGTGNSSPYGLFNYGGFLYFTGNDGDSSLWRTDGTASGTIKTDLFPAIANDAPNNATPLGNNVYFTGRAPGVNTLIEWDGTTAAAAPDAVNSGAVINCTQLGTFNNLLITYMSYAPDAATIGFEVYLYNPATDTYTLLKDIAAGTANSGASNFTTIGNKFYFEAEGNLWESDGATANTIEVPGAATLGLNGLSNLFAFNNLLLFEADNGAGDQLWKLDTTTGVITQLSTNSGTNPDHDPSDYAILNGIVYYAGEDSNDNKSNLFSTDGITITQIDNTIIDIDEIIVFNNVLYFEGDQDGVTGNELFTYNPATATINEVLKASKISLYPNPTQNKVFVKNNNDLVNTFTIYDLAGRVMSQGKIINNELDLNFKPGIYIVELVGTQTRTTQKLIIE
jgi:ELWxxDGT repeat protein